MNSRLLIGIKYLFQLGIRPLALYALYKFGLLTGHYKRITPSTPNFLVPTSYSLFTLPNRDQLSEILGEEGKATLLKEADEIVNGQICVFGELTPLDFDLNQPLQHWTEYEKSAILHSAFNIPHSDIKFLWEPARFEWAFTLGRAYHLTQDERYAEAFWKYFESFTQNNPVNLGPHWMNGQEIAIRLISFVWCAHVFSDTTHATRNAQLATSIFHHASRIPSTLIYARSQNNNHLVTEAAALYTAGLFFKNSNWRRLGWKWLNWAFQNQISGYGEYIQHSTNYHRVMLQTTLWINFIKQDVFSTKTSQAIGRSAHWLFSLLDNASGLTPNLGANDGALIFPLGSAFEDYRPTVQAAARAFLRTSLPPGIWDEMSLWFGLKATDRVADSSAYLTENLRGQNSWAYFRASNFKSRLSHMDQLNLDLWWHGLNITQDAGTYLYNAAPPWDNPMVTTRVHNTVTVDGHDQMTRAGRFLVLDWANAYSKNVVEAEENILGRMRAHHRGYGSVKHERTATVFQNERWLIEDKLTSPRRRPHTYRLHWLLPDYEWKMENRESGVTLKLNSPHGWIILSVYSSFILHPSSFSLVRAGKIIYGQRDTQPYEGWVSRTYGQKSPALSLAFEVTSEFHTTLTSEFIFPQ